MAFVDAPRQANIAGTFTGTQSSGPTLALAADILVSGTFTGTVMLQAQSLTGNWVNACLFTEEGAMTVMYSRMRPLRVSTVSVVGNATFSLEPATEYLEERG